MTKLTPEALTELREDLHLKSNDHGWRDVEALLDAVQRVLDSRQDLHDAISDELGVYRDYMGEAQFNSIVDNAFATIRGAVYGE